MKKRKMVEKNIHQMEERIAQWEKFRIAPTNKSNTLLNNYFQKQRGVINE